MVRYMGSICTCLLQEMAFYGVNLYFSVYKGITLYGVNKLHRGEAISWRRLNYYAGCFTFVDNTVEDYFLCVCD